MIYLNYFQNLLNVAFHLSRIFINPMPAIIVQYLGAFGFWLFVCACVCDCVRSHIMIDWQWERQHHPKLAEKPYIPGLRAVNLNTDYRLKHVARSHHCFSKYFQSQGLEIIASGQGWDWFPKQALCVMVVRFHWRFENKNQLHLPCKSTGICC